ncbi:GNAT family N-acetyltransferase [Virgibacillus salinus]|uniref:Acetyltransferase (GNAT) domain-containing protein n=1 Tax=Virgibacillus salinus TaxID=553311 RepID=A0A1H1F1S9_9BACI|nr:GNAT family N-acetyltransferase [Virgibacillus salinus]SDQ94851.1 Acetyltransferase (GNAT) domain-containing protein [Virgibacillus salinus]
MDKTIRVLNSNDFKHLEKMNTGIEDDYIKRIFNRLITGKNRLYGLFLDDQMVSLGGYSIYASRYAMLGRLRTDRRFMGKGFSTELMYHMMNKAFQINGIQWVGANTQEHNTPARRVMERIGLTPYIPQHAAQTKDTTALETGSEPWTPVTDLQQKKDWLKEMYSKPTSIFPYECYYSFPVSKNLFQEHDLMKWSFYENRLKTRALITKTDQKKHHYLHAIYPWNDIASQEGLWETIANDYQQLRNQTEEETYIWMDLTKEQVNALPANHKFALPSPWILYGIDKSNWEMAQALA